MIVGCDGYDAALAYRAASAITCWSGVSHGRAAKVTATDARPNGLEYGERVSDAASRLSDRRGLNVATPARLAELGTTVKMELIGSP